MNRKDKRRSGWTTPGSTLRMKKRDLVSECLEPQEFYDDWNDYRDGMRCWMNDRSKLKKNNMLKSYSSWAEDRTEAMKENNFKLKRLLERRRMRKLSFRNK